VWYTYVYIQTLRCIRFVLYLYTYSVYKVYGIPPLLLGDVVYGLYALLGNHVILQFAAYPSSVTMDPSTSNTVLLQTIMFLQAENDAANAQLTRLKNINNAQASVIRGLQADARVNAVLLDRYAQGSDILVRALDGMYQQAKHLLLIQRLEHREWDEFMRQMLRADVGFAIINGAPALAQLTTEEELDEDTEDEESV